MHLVTARTGSSLEQPDNTLGSTEKPYIATLLGSAEKPYLAILEKYTLLTPLKLKGKETGRFSYTIGNKSEQSSNNNYDVRTLGSSSCSHEAAVDDRTASLIKRTCNAFTRSLPNFIAASALFLATLPICFIAWPLAYLLIREEAKEDVDMALAQKRINLLIEIRNDLNGISNTENSYDYSLEKLKKGKGAELKQYFKEDVESLIFMALKIDEETLSSFSGKTPVEIWKMLKQVPREISAACHQAKLLGHNEATLANFAHQIKSKQQTFDSIRKDSNERYNDWCQSSENFDVLRELIQTHGLGIEYLNDLTKELINSADLNIKNVDEARKYILDVLNNIIITDNNGLLEKIAASKSNQDKATIVRLAALMAEKAPALERMGTEELKVARQQIEARFIEWRKPLPFESAFTSLGVANALTRLVSSDKYTPDPKQSPYSNLEVVNLLKGYGLDLETINLITSKRVSNDIPNSDISGKSRQLCYARRTLLAELQAGGEDSAKANCLLHKSFDCDRLSGNINMALERTNNQNLENQTDFNLSRIKAHEKSNNQDMEPNINPSITDTLYRDGISGEGLRPYHIIEDNKTGIKINLNKGTRNPLNDFTSPLFSMIDNIGLSNEKTKELKNQVQFVFAQTYINPIAGCITDEFHTLNSGFMVRDTGLSPSEEEPVYFEYNKSENKFIARLQLTSNICKTDNISVKMTNTASQITAEFIFDLNTEDLNPNCKITDVSSCAAVHVAHRQNEGF